MTALLELRGADRRLPCAGDVIAGKYRVDEFIARGGMGAVLAATHLITGRRMALKWLLPHTETDAEATHRLVREARAAARVRHPNVVDVYDVGEHDGSLFLVMELLEGDTLHARLEAGGALDARTTLALLLPALRGVEAAHRSRVVHRDLKPSNIFLCRDPHGGEVTPRVLDFGISKVLRATGDDDRSLTWTGAVLGTPQYMALEQLTGGDVDARTDVYALGVILYQCLTARLPFHDRNYNALVVQIATATPPAITALAPRTPPGLAAIVMRAMARDSAARFASVSALSEALRPFCNEAQAATAPAAGRRPRPSSFVWVACAAAVVWLTWKALSGGDAWSPSRRVEGQRVEAREQASSQRPSELRTGGVRAQPRVESQQPPWPPPEAASYAPREQSKKDTRRKHERTPGTPAAALPAPGRQAGDPLLRDPVRISADQF
jgi:serine/threonine protein kinase